MPPPTLVPTLAFDKGMPTSSVSVSFDASIFKIWRDGTEYGNSNPKYPYWAMDLHVAAWPTSSSTVLARYTGGKLVKGALYQLSGRFFVTTSLHGQESYLHIDEAVRFQGPGTIRSVRTPQFMMVGEVVSINETDLTVSWVTRDPYRRNMVYDQTAIVTFETPLHPDGKGLLINQLCTLEGRMDSCDHRQDWVCNSVVLI